MKNPGKPASIVATQASHKSGAGLATDADAIAAVLHSAFQEGLRRPRLYWDSLRPWLPQAEEKQPKQSATASDIETPKPKKRRPRGETTCKRLERLHLEDPDFAESAPLREVGRRIGRRAGTIHESNYYKTVLQPRRAELLARKKCARAAKQWWHCDSTGEQDESLENL